MVPDDLVVGRMGGHNVVNHVANFHSWMLLNFQDAGTGDAGCCSDCGIKTFKVNKQSVILERVGHTTFRFVRL